MKTRSRLIILFLITFWAEFKLVAQQKFEIAAQFIPRLEQRHGYRTLATNNSKSAIFVSERIRISLDYRNKYIRLFSSLQDTRVWGNEEQTKTLPSFGLHEGWAEVFIKNKAAIKFGRQELVYDDHRLFGNLDWVQSARSHDGMIIKINHKNMQLHIGGAFNQSAENILGTTYKLKNYKALAYLWYHQNLDSNRIGISYYTVTDGLPTTDSIPKTKFRLTTGALVNLKYSHLNAYLGFYVQTGKTIADKAILAYMANLYAEYSKQKFNIGVGCDYISGQRSNTNKYNAFYTLYPTNHKFYGHMDYFLDLPTDTKLGGLLDIYSRINYKIKDKGSIGFDAHYFLSGNKVADVNNSGNYLKLPLGFESDIYGIYKPYDFMEIKAGYSFLLGTTSMQAIKGGNKDTYNGWSFVMVSLKPSLFKWEK